MLLVQQRINPYCCSFRTISLRSVLDLPLALSSELTSKHFWRAEMDVTLYRSTTQPESNFHLHLSAPLQNCPFPPYVSLSIPVCLGWSASVCCRIGYFAQAGLPLLLSWYSLCFSLPAIRKWQNVLLAWIDVANSKPTEAFFFNLLFFWINQMAFLFLFLKKV